MVKRDFGVMQEKFNGVRDLRKRVIDIFKVND